MNLGSSKARMRLDDETFCAYRNKDALVDALCAAAILGTESERRKIAQKNGKLGTFFLLSASVV